MTFGHKVVIKETWPPTCADRLGKESNHLLDQHRSVAQIWSLGNSDLRKAFALISYIGDMGNDKIKSNCDFYFGLHVDQNKEK